MVHCVMDKCTHETIAGSKFCKAHYLQVTEFQPNALHIVNDIYHFCDSRFRYPMVYDHDQRVHAWMTYDREKNTCSISVVNSEWQTLWMQWCHQCAQKFHEKATLKTTQTEEDKKQEAEEVSKAEDAVCEKLTGRQAYETVTFDAMQEIRFTQFGNTIIYSPPKSADQFHFVDSCGLLMWMQKDVLDRGMKVVEHWEQSQKSKISAEL